MNNKENLIKYLKILLGTYIVIGLIALLNSALIFDLSLNAMAITGIFSVCTFGYGIFIRNRKYITAAIGVAIIYVLLAIFFSPLISYKEHRNLIGNIEEVDFSSQIEYMDINQLPIIDEELANKLADKKLGEISSLGSQVTVGELDLQSVNGQLYYVGPLEHSSFLKWLTNREGTIGYIKVSATNQNDVQLVTKLGEKDIKLKYLNSAYILSDLNRAAYFRDMKAGHTDFTFELDDSGRPYWVITRYDTGIGITEAKAVGALIMDAQTGESNVYDINNLPSWVDRIQPMKYIDRYINKWGELVHGVLNFTDKDKLKSTGGMNIIYNKEKCYYYTGITSVGSDESLVGFTLTNTRTGETKLYKTSGATEEASMKSAEGKVQQYNVIDNEVLNLII